MKRDEIKVRRGTLQRGKEEESGGKEKGEKSRGEQKPRSNQVEGTT